MYKKTGNINWVIELLLLVAYVLLFTVQLYSFDEKYFQVIVTTLTLINSAIIILYAAFGFAIFNSIPIQDIFKKSSYSGLPVTKILLGGLAGFVIAFYAYSRGCADNFTVASVLVLHIATIAAIVTVFTRARIMAKRVLYRLGIATLLLLLVKVLPDYYFLEIKYRNHPQYIKAVEAFETNPYDTAAYAQYRIETEKLTKYSESVH